MQAIVSKLQAKTIFLSATFVKKHLFVLVFCFLTGLLPAQIAFHKMYFETGIQSSFYRHNVPAYLMLELVVPPNSDQRGRLPKFFSWNSGETSSSSPKKNATPKKKSRKYTPRLFRRYHPAFLALGGGADYLFIENKWLLDFQAVYTIQHAKVDVDDYYSYYDTQLIYAAMHYKISPDGKMQYLMPEIGGMLLFFKLGLGYNIPLTQREPWNHNFYLSLRIPLSFWWNRNIDPDY